jgi:hypothetical protein
LQRPDLGGCGMMSEAESRRGFDQVIGTRPSYYSRRNDSIRHIDTSVPGLNCHFNPSLTQTYSTEYAGLRTNSDRAGAAQDRHLSLNSPSLSGLCGLPLAGHSGGFCIQLQGAALARPLCWGVLGTDLRSADSRVGGAVNRVDQADACRAEFASRGRRRSSGGRVQVSPVSVRLIQGHASSPNRPLSVRPRPTHWALRGSSSDLRGLRKFPVRQPPARPNPIRRSVGSCLPGRGQFARGTLAVCGFAPPDTGGRRDSFGGEKSAGGEAKVAPAPGGFCRDAL